MIRMNPLTHAAVRMRPTQAQLSQSAAATAGQPLWQRFDTSTFEGGPVLKGGAASPEVSSLVEQVLQGVLQRLNQLFGGGLNLGAGAGAGAPAAGGLQPTPLRRGEVPGQISEVNTPQNKNIARPSQFNDAVNQAIDAVRAQGKGIDPQDPDRITNFDLYHQSVVQELLRRGYHAAYDGEELSVGRAGDDFNEQFDISTWKGQVRRFYAGFVSPPVWASGS